MPVLHVWNRAHWLNRKLFRLVVGRSPLRYSAGTSTVAKVFRAFPQLLLAHVAVLLLIKPLAVQFAIYAAWPDAGYLYTDGKQWKLRRPKDPRWTPSLTTFLTTFTARLFLGVSSRTSQEFCNWNTCMHFLFPQPDYLASTSYDPRFHTWETQIEWNIKRALIPGRFFDLDVNW